MEKSGRAPIEAYFQSYREIGNTEIDQLLSDPQNVFTHALRKRFAGKPTKTLLLGSATPRNLSSLQDYVNERVGINKFESDLYLIDNQTDSLQPHKAYADDDEWYPRVHVVGSDIRTHAFTPGTFDMIFSDYTTTFLPEEKDWQQFLDATAQSLSPDGYAVIACFTSLEQGIPAMLHTTVNDIDRTCASHAALMAMIEKAGLEIESQFYRPAARMYDGHASQVATLLLKKRA